jgi:hypothetical protein
MSGRGYQFASSSRAIGKLDSKLRAETGRRPLVIEGTHRATGLFLSSRPVAKQPPYALPLATEEMKAGTC